MALKQSVPAMVVLLPVLLAACGTNSAISDRRALLQAAPSLLRPSEPNPTADEIRARITPEIRQLLSGTPAAIVTLEDQALSSIIYQAAANGAVATFFTPDNRSLSFREGVLVATRGLGFDLMSTDTGDAVQAIRGRGSSYTRLYQYLDGEEAIVSLTFRCTAQGNGLVHETCQGDWGTVENSYSVGSDGDILASRQWIGPERGYLRVEPALVD